MDKQQLLTHINEVLRRDWTRDELAAGKLVELPWDARPLLREVRQAYAVRGWRVVTMASLTGSGRRIALCFSNPRWSLDSLGLS